MLAWASLFVAVRPGPERWDSTVTCGITQRVLQAPPAPARWATASSGSSPSEEALAESPLWLRSQMSSIRSPCLE